MLDRTVFCPACDRDVPVLDRERPAGDDRDRRRASGAFLCLDYGVLCTGEMCPLSALPSTSDERAAHREGVARRHGDAAALHRLRRPGERPS